MTLLGFNCFKLQLIIEITPVYKLSDLLQSHATCSFDSCFGLHFIFHHASFGYLTFSTTMEDSGEWLLLTKLEISFWQEQLKQAVSTYSRSNINFS